MLRLRLIFADLVEFIGKADIEIRIEDQSEADAPAKRLASTTLESEAIQQQSILIETELGAVLPQNQDELALMVKVRGVDKNQQPLVYFNTESTTLNSDRIAPTDVVLTRVR